MILNRRRSRGKHAAKKLSPEDKISIMSSALQDIMQPTRSGAAWITAGDLARYVSLRRRYSCSIEEINSALSGKSLPADDLIASAYEIRNAMVSDEFTSASSMKRRAVDEDLALRILKSETVNTKTLSRSTRLVRMLKSKAILAFGAVAAGLVTLVATGVIPGLAGQLINFSSIEDRFRPGPPIIIASVSQENDGLFLVPGQAKLSPAAAKVLAGSDSPSYGGLMNKETSKAIPLAYGLFDIVLQGNRNQEIRILGIRPTGLQKERPVNGVAFTQLGQGMQPNISFGYDLDAADPQAVKVGNYPGVLTKTPYFTQNSISLSKGEQVVLTISFSTLCYDVQFKLQVIYLEGSTKESTIISYNGKPFNVTSFLSDYPSYNELFSTNKSDTGLIPLGTSKLAAFQKQQKQVGATCPFSVP